MRGRGDHSRVVEYGRVEKLVLGKFRRTGADGVGNRASGFGFALARLRLGGSSSPLLAVLGASVLKPDLHLAFGQPDCGRDGRFALRRDVRASFVLGLQFEPLLLRVNRSILVSRSRLA